MPVDAFAGRPHYHDHIWPIWEALPDPGTFYVSPAAKRPGTLTKSPPPGGPIIVAGFPDLGRVRGRPVIFIEHGAGERWGSKDPHYAGGPGRDSVVLFLCPNQGVADANAARYPDAAVVVNGSPRLQKLAERSVSGKERDGRLRVVVSFHWENQTYPQTRSAWTHFRPYLGSWAADSRIELRGHGHPRWIDKLEVSYAKYGIPTIREFSDVVAWADVYAVDNSSTLFEASALGIPVVLLEAPWYQQFPGSYRFYEHAGIGPMVAEPSTFVDSTIHAHADASGYAAARQRMVAEMFGTVDTRLAIEAITAIGQHDDAWPEGKHPGTPPGSLTHQPSLLSPDS